MPDRRLIPVWIGVVMLSTMVLMGQECVAQTNPCDPDPCQSIANAVADSCAEIGGSCTGPSDYMCNCDTGYTWKAATHKCEEEPPGVLITGVSPSAVAHGAQVTIDGIGFAGTTSVSIGGREQPFAEFNAERITIITLSDLTPMGTQDLVVTASAGISPPFSVTVIHLGINELDCDTEGTDTKEFIEVSTGVLPDVVLDGYVLVLYNGASDTSYYAIDLGDGGYTTDGLLLIGNSGVTPTPAIVFPDNTLQNGADGAAIYQGAAVDFPYGTTPTYPPGIPIFDALVYDTSDVDDFGLMAGLGVLEQVDENQNSASQTESINRCPDPNLPFTWYYLVQTPSPGADNACP